jgi:hypothetical protein
LGTAAVGAPSRRWPPRVFVRRHRLIPELHHDALVPSSPTTGATYRSSGLAPTIPSTEPPPLPRALSGEPLLPDVPQMSPPPHRVALAAIPDPPRQRQTSESGRPPPPLLLASWAFPCLAVGRQPAKKPCARSVQRWPRCGPVTMPWPRRHHPCHGPRDTVPVGHRVLC